MFTARWVGRWPVIRCPSTAASHSRSVPAVVGRCCRRSAPHPAPAADPSRAGHPGPRPPAALGQRRGRRRGRGHGRRRRAAHRDLLGRAVPRDAAAQLPRPRLVRRRLVGRPRRQTPARATRSSTARSRCCCCTGSTALVGVEGWGTVATTPEAYDVRHLGVVAHRPGRHGGRRGHHPGPARLVALGAGHRGGAAGAADVDRAPDVQRQGRPGRDRLHAGDPRAGRDGGADARPSAPAGASACSPGWC